MAQADPLTSELQAMAVIARVLETLPDDAARQRVIRWAAGRVGVDAIAFSAAVAQVAPKASVAVTDDPALKLGSLDDMFEARPSNEDLRIDDSVAATSDAAKAPVADLLKSFAAEFQRFAEEWNGATA